MAALARISKVFCAGRIWWRFLLVVAVVAAFRYWSLAGPEWTGPASDFFYVRDGELRIRHRDGSISTVFNSPTYYLDKVDRRGEGFVAFAVNIDPVGTSTMLLLTGDGKILSTKLLEFEVLAVSVRPRHPNQAILVTNWPGTAIFRLVAMADLGSEEPKYQDLGECSVLAHPEWSPEGVEFAYCDINWNIILYDWSEQRKTLVAREAYSPTWLGASRMLCYLRGRSVFQQDLNSHKETVLRRVYFFGDGLQAISGSRDGKEVLYRAGTDFSSSVGVMEVRNGRLHQLLRGWSTDIGWMPSLQPNLSSHFATVSR